MEESAAAAQSLREQADHLAREVSMFKVNAASYGPAQAAIGAARGAAKVTASLSPARATPAPAAGGTAASAARIGTTNTSAALAKAPAPSSVGKTGSQKNAKQGAAAGAEEDWESF